MSGGRPRALDKEALQRVLLLRQRGHGYRRIAALLKRNGIDAHFRTAMRAVKGLQPYAGRPHDLTCCQVNAIRSINGMSQKRLFAVLKVSHRAVSRWENGADTPNDPAVLERLHHLAVHFGPVEDLRLGAEFTDLLREAVEVPSLRGRIEMSRRGSTVTYKPHRPPRSTRRRRVAPTAE